MFNPLKMNPVEKRLLIGGLTNSVIYYADLYAKDLPGYPQELKNRLDPHLASNGDIVASIAPPVALWLVKKIVKNPSIKEKVGDMALGAALYGFPNLMHDMAVQAAYQVGVESRPAARLPATASANSRYIVQTATPTPMRPSGGISKYVVTA